MEKVAFHHGKLSFHHGGKKKLHGGKNKRSEEKNNSWKEKSIGMPKNEELAIAVSDAQRTDNEEAKATRSDSPLQQA